jgi:hypothetical protein
VTLSSGATFTATVRSTFYTSGSTLVPPAAAGSHYLLVGAQLSSTGPTAVQFSPQQFAAETADGAVYSASSYGGPHALLEGTLESAQTITGTVGFFVPSPQTSPVVHLVLLDKVPVNGSSTELLATWSLR